MNGLENINASLRTVVHSNTKFTPSSRSSISSVKKLPVKRKNKVVNITAPTHPIKKTTPKKIKTPTKKKILKKNKK